MRSPLRLFLGVFLSSFLSSCSLDRTDSFSSSANPSEGQILNVDGGQSCKNIVKAETGSLPKPWARIPNYSFIWSSQNQLTVTGLRIRLQGNLIKNGEQVIDLTLEEVRYMFCGAGTSCPTGDAIPLNNTGTPREPIVVNSQTACGLIFGGISLVNTNVSGTVRGTARILGYETDAAGTATPLRSDTYFTLNFSGSDF